MSYEIVKVDAVGGCGAGIGKTLIVTDDGWQLIDQYQKMCKANYEASIKKPPGPNTNTDELIEELMVSGIFSCREDFFTLWQLSDQELNLEPN